jgi:hypothetical protein
VRLHAAKETALLVLTAFFVTITFFVLQFGVGVDSTRTLEIGAACKVIAILVYAPLALLAYCWSLYRDTESPNGDGSRLRLRYPKYWLLVGAAQGAFAIAVIVAMGLEICATVAPRFGGQVEYSVATVEAVRDRAEIMGTKGLELNCARYIELKMSDGESTRLCYRRRKTADALSAVEPAAGDEVSLQMRRNAIGAFVEQLTLVSR